MNFLGENLIMPQQLARQTLTLFINKSWLSTKLCHLRVRNNPLCYFTHMHEQQGECQDPSQVVSGEVQPGVVVNLHFGALASPAWEMIARKEKAYLTASQ